jgi:hypothetical protein
MMAIDAASESSLVRQDSSRLGQESSSGLRVVQDSGGTDMPCTKELLLMHNEDPAPVSRIHAPVYTYVSTYLHV